MANENKALAANEIGKRLKDLPQWSEAEDSLVRGQKFNSYRDALDFVYAVGKAADKNDHHPDMRIDYKTVEVRFSTHSAGGITALDFKMAAAVEALIPKFLKRS